MTSTELTELHKEIILDHNAKPRNYGKLGSFSHYAKGYNESTGDEIEIFLDITDKHIISDISYTLAGGAVFTASASIMSQMVKSKSVSEAKEMQKHLFAMLTDKDSHCDEQVLGDLIVLCGIRKFPARVRCAGLPWKTLLYALDKVPKIANTEHIL